MGVIDDVKEIKTDCRRLVIVEKESAMYQMHQEITKIIEKGNNNINKISQESIFMSGKGYPDSTSRTLVQLLLPLVQDIFYLGDSDIYGADILLTYSIGLNDWATFLPRVKWVQLEKII